MKKSVKRLAFGALAAAAAMQFAACRNRPETVYGPPEYFTKTAPENNVPEVVYGPPEMLETWQQATEFVPEENEPVDVYGPPSMLGVDDPEEEPETAAAETSEAEARK